MDLMLLQAILTVLNIYSIWFPGFPVENTIQTCCYLALCTSSVVPPVSLWPKNHLKVSEEKDMQREKVTSNIANIHFPPPPFIRKDEEQKNGQAKCEDIEQ